ncbi:MAG: DeoR/GlpR transcriptional regulator [Tateyamaria sp.]|jgi:DeoR/GlpR family transcriptional regulator of sugar metabolism|nr:DeoR/GlpR transcriptional regulator [Tateyamaria sp.]HAB39124.1 DeoR/GlpR transcriptional regulator [Paracoccaceae bacterium]MBT6268059.1 DeoR/GlpR transcriptional regulator [Tateyamaria sp.]MBT6342814.1 DeoR/GlpR transcriptional regulator [Tateyamaria sp.]MBT7802425.1 DeoR/GlpR transcriptional regulator [Tateyamaria sp.]
MSKKKQRHDNIMRVLSVNPTTRVNALAGELGVSAETVRRDLSELDRTGQLNRTYGGAVLNKTIEPALSERSKLHIKARETIAQLAVEHIGEANSLFIGAGATLLHFARVLKEIDRKITILTPAFSIATELSHNPLLEIIFLPGVFEPREGMVVGGETLNFITKFRTQIAVVGASGVDHLGISEFLPNAAQIYTAMINNAIETLVLADSSKFGTRSLQETTPLKHNLCLITEISPDQSMSQAISDSGAKLLFPQMNKFP